MAEKRTIRCPRCRTPVVWEENRHRPFCSERCRLLDLGAWAGEEYRIPGPKADPEEHGKLIEFPKKHENSE